MCSVTLNYVKGDDAPFIEGLRTTRTARDMQSINTHSSDILQYPRVFFVQSFCSDDRDATKDTLREVIERAQNLRVFKSVNAIKSVESGPLTALIGLSYGQSLTV